MSGGGPIRVALVTNFVPGYRTDFLRRLAKSVEIDVTVFCSDGAPDHFQLASHDALVRPLSSWCLGPEAVVWQRLPLRALARSFDVVFLYGNPRYLSNVVASFLLRWMGQKVVIQGQAHSHTSRGWSEKLRIGWWRRFGYHFVYTDADAERLKQLGFDSVVIGMNNGLDQTAIDEARSAWGRSRLAAWQERQGLAGRPVMLSCARLVTKNRFHEVLDAMPTLLARHPGLVWCLIGDGPDRRRLEEMAAGRGLSDHVRFVGALHEEAELAPWFCSARFLIHPGAIGLTLLHAFGYGVPVLTHDSVAHHGPEACVLEPERNGLVYSRGDQRALIAGCLALLDDPAGAAAMGRCARATVRKQYNTAVMAERFHEMAHHAAAGSRS